MTPRTVAVLGGCTTRDNFNSEFNPGYRRWYTVTASANQSSVIALMSPPIEAEVVEADGLGPYDTWNVRSDLGRELLADLAQDPPDYLLVDFFADVYFGVLQLPDGRYATDNRWKLHRTAQYADWVASGAIVRRVNGLDGDLDLLMELWTAALDRFVAYLAEHCPQTRVILHRGFFTKKLVDGPTGRPRSLMGTGKLVRADADAVNELWARLDDHALATYGWDVIDLRGERYTSTAEHKWGPFWAHYTADYYHRFLGELHLIDLAHRADTSAAERIAAIGEAGRERLRTQEKFRRAAYLARVHDVRQLTDRTVRQAARRLARSWVPRR